MRPFRQPDAQARHFSDHSAPILAGNSVSAHSLRQLVALVADAHDPLLLTGPTGSGKLALARAVHAMSPLAGASFAATKGEFFNADILSARWDGVLYVDDIELMPVNTQLGLLRWLDTEQARRVRLIAASSAATPQENVIAPLQQILWRLRIPCTPLSRRREDVPVIVRQMWMNEPDRLAPILDQECWALLSGHRRAASFRELETLAHRLQHLFGGRMVSPEQLRNFLDGRDEKWLESERFDLKQHLAQEERRFLVEALLRSDGVVASAATLAGLKRTTFLAKMKRHGLARI